MQAKDSWAEENDLLPIAESQIGVIATQITLSRASHIGQSVLSDYARTDLLRPYFQIAGSEVISRIFLSFVPQRTPAMLNLVDLYGPTVLLLTQVAILVLRMKISSIVVHDGTLFGTAFGISIAYIVLASSLSWLTSFVNHKQPLTFLQVTCLIGYSQFSICMVMLFDVLIPFAIVFWIGFFTFGVLAALRLALPLFHRGQGGWSGWITSGIAFTTHLAFIVYLHFQYGVIVSATQKTLS